MPSADAPEPRKLWGGHLDPGAGRAAERFTASIGFDRRLWREDLAGSRAHARMLARQGLLTTEELKAILAGLDAIAAQFEAGTIVLSAGDEDIHLNIERRLTELVGAPAKKLHAGRSRNDQVALDEHLYLKGAIPRLDAGLRGLQAALVERAEADFGAVCPGYTHLQPAQPILVSHHWLAYFWKFQRDRERLRDALARADRCPLGAGALAGSGLDLDPAWTAAELGFGGLYENSLDAVSNRDAILETLSALAVATVHASRLAADLIGWASREFGFVVLDPGYTTGSSIMPQKQNPDVLELVRGKAGRVIGHLTGLLATVKGLPLAYHSDLQEDKEPLFDAVDTALASFDALAGVVRTLRIRPDRMRAALAGSYANATDLVELLVRRGVPFRDAHAIAGRLVRHCQERGIELEACDPAEAAAVVPEVDAELLASLAMEACVERRRTPGGTAPARVREQIAAARRLLEG